LAKAGIVWIVGANDRSLGESKQKDLGGYVYIYIYIEIHIDKWMLTTFLF